jgi:hypothetical protein
VESSCECGYEFSGCIKCWESIECPNRGLSSSAQLHGVKKGRCGLDWPGSG